MPDSERATPLSRIGAYILAGFLLPWVVILLAALWYQRYDEVASFPAHLFAAGYNYFTVACLNVIPFGVVGIAAFADLKLSRPSRTRRFGLAFGGVVVLLTSILCQGLAWFNLLGPRPDALTGVVFLVFPWIATLSFVVSALGASLIGAWWLRGRTHK